MSAIGREIGQGLAWTGAAKGFAQIVGLGVTLALARLLTPEEFGLVGMVVVATGFLRIFGEMGFATALVQRSELEERHRSTVFWLNVVSGLLLGGLLFLAAPFIARFYQEERLGWLVRVLALDFLLAPVSMVQHAVLSRQMNFRALALVDAAAVLVSNGVALGLALAGFGVWALVAQGLASTAAAAVTLWLVSDWRPRLLFDKNALAELWSFSANLIGVNVVGYWANELDDLLIGRVLGARPLGLYARAHATMMMPVTQVGGALSRVLFPAFSKIKEDPAEVRRLYLRTVAVIGFVTFPVMLGMAALAEPFIRVLYGTQWTDASTVLAIYCVVGASQAVGTTTTWIYTSTGRTDLLLRWNLAGGALLIAAIAVGIRLGSIESVAVAYAVMSVGVLSYPRYAIPGRLIGVRPGEVLAAVRGTLASAAAAAAVAWGLGPLLAPRLSAGLDLAVRAGLCAVGYLVLARLFRVRGYSEALAAVRSRLE
jgi:O-antigen/teichoic acid export membrane protein